MMWQSSLIKYRSPTCKFLISLFKKDLSIYQKIYFKECNIPVVKIIGTLFAEYPLVALPSIENQQILTRQGKQEQQPQPQAAVPEPLVNP